MEKIRGSIGVFQCLVVDQGGREVRKGVFLNEDEYGFFCIIVEGCYVVLC